MKKKLLPMRLQLFAAPGAEGGQGGEANNTQGQQSQQNNQQGGQPIQIDYDKLESIISGKQKVTEDAILKNFFKEQGLSQDEMKQAIATFKEQKAKNTPDVAAIQSELANTQNMVKQATIDREAILLAFEMGLDAKTAPYLIKLADFSEVIEGDGKVNKETMKKAMEKVLEDVPNLKPVAQNQSGFHIGGNNGDNNSNSTTEDQLRGIFGISK